MKEIRIIVNKDNLSRIECTRCGSLLFKAKKLSLIKSTNVEIKCRKCGKLVNLSL